MIKIEEKTRTTFPNDLLCILIDNNAPYYKFYKTYSDIDLNNYVIGSVNSDQTISNEFGFRVKDFIEDYGITNIITKQHISCGVEIFDKYKRNLNFSKEIIFYQLGNHNMSLKKLSNGKIDLNWNYNKQFIKCLKTYSPSYSIEILMRFILNFQESDSRIISITRNGSYGNISASFSITVDDLIDYIGEMKVIGRDVVSQGLLIKPVEVSNYSSTHPEDWLSIDPDGTWIGTGKKIVRYDVRCEEMLNEKYWTNYNLK